MTTEERREYAHEHYRNNKDKYKEYHRKWREKNAERVKEQKRKWNEKNAERIKELSHLNYEKKKNNDPEYAERQRQRTYNRYHNDPEYVKQHLQHIKNKYQNDPEYAKRQRQYSHDRYHNDPAYRGSRLFYRYKRLDIKKNVAPADPSEYPTLKEVNEMLLQPCVWCGETDWHKIGLDRKDNRFGHVRGNIQPCCKRCNDKKGKLSNEEFRQVIADTTAVPAMPSMRSLLV